MGPKRQYLQPTASSTRKQNKLILEDAKKKKSNKILADDSDQV